MLKPRESRQPASWALRSERLIRRRGKSPGPALPAGAAILLRIGSAVVINPQDQTYWTLPGVPGGTLALMDPQMVSKRTGEFTMVAGLRAERSAYSVTLNLPLPANVQLPLPKTLTMDGEMWVTNEYKTYASTLADVTTVAVPGISVGIFGPLPRQHAGPPPTLE